MHLESRSSRGVACPDYKRADKPRKHDAAHERPRHFAVTLPHHGSGVNSLTMERGAAQAYAFRMSDPRQREEEERREALRTLDRLRDSDTFASSALARTARRATDHFAARDTVN